ncbi:MAG: T9SS type A sorting domain-containing protein [Cyclobacteriaceae bacterium]|nr:T9SS type A sorting domain-containing protein [Cyclobacteriaceae bacterium]
MKRPIVKAALFAVLTGTVFLSNAQDKMVRLDSEKENIYQLTYLNHKDSNIKVQWMDNSGKVLFTDYVNHRKSFTRNYNAERLPSGHYLVKVTDEEGEYLGFLDKSQTSGINASIVPTEPSKAKVTVRGETKAPVHVRVIDKKGKLVFHDEVKCQTGFSRQYDLSQLAGKNVIIEVTTGDSLLARAEFK